jgi:primase-polymerase (primpol)-like protein
LYREIFSGKTSTIEEAELKSFYDTSNDKFQVADSFNVSLYVGSQEDLDAITKNPMLRPEGVHVEDTIIAAETLNDRLKVALNATKDGTFTQILNIENKPTMFYVKEKKGLSILPFDKVKDSIYSYLSNQKEQEIINDYFEKLKASASIKVLRSPM